jgi:molybdopterin-guanine dinucleotide biosynthesis protein A
LLNFQKAGKISPRDFLKQEDTHIIEIPDRNALANINSPEELEKFRSNFRGA